MQKKELATNLFKLGKYKKACRLYQRINEYFNFGELDADCPNEDKNTPEYKQIRESLNIVKVQCFINVAICKYKLGEYQSCANVAQQVTEIDPKNIKGYFWMAKGLLNVKNYKDALKSIEIAKKLDPNNSEISEEYTKIKDAHSKFIENEKSKYSKMFK